MLTIIKKTEYFNILKLKCTYIRPSPSFSKEKGQSSAKDVTQCMYFSINKTNLPTCVLVLQFIQEKLMNKKFAICW